LIQEQAEFAANNPTPIRQPLTSILLRAAAFSDRVIQLYAIGVNDAHHTCFGHESLGHMAVRAKEAKQARSLPASSGIDVPISRRPAVKGTIADTLQSKQEGQDDDFARVESCLRVLLNIRQLFINAKEQFYGKFFSGRGLQSVLVWSPTH
jgi:hypothetical protein